MIQELVLSIENVGGMLCETYGIRDESIIANIAKYGAQLFFVVFVLACIAVLYLLVCMHIEKKKLPPLGTSPKLNYYKKLHTWALVLSLSTLVALGVCITTWFLTRVPYYESKRSLRDAGCAPGYWQ